MCIENGILKPYRISYKETPSKFSVPQSHHNNIYTKKNFWLKINYFLVCKKEREIEFALLQRQHLPVFNSFIPHIYKHAWHLADSQLFVINWYYNQIYSLSPWWILFAYLRTYSLAVSISPIINVIIWLMISFFPCLRWVAQLMKPYRCRCCCFLSPGPRKWPEEHIRSLGCSRQSQHFVFCFKPLV